MQRITITLIVLVLSMGFSGLVIAQLTPFGTIEGTPAEDANFGDEPKNLAVGDVNGDTFTDLVVGGRGYGRIRIYLGTDVGIDGEADLTIDLSSLLPDTVTSASWFAHAVAVGDLNADGYDDVVTGTYSTSVNDTAYAGHAYVYFGGDPMDNELDLRIACPHPFKTNAYFGKGLIIGNFNADGVDDLVVAATRGSIYANRPYSLPGNYYDVNPSETYNGILYFYAGGAEFDDAYDMDPIIGQTSSGQAGDRALDIGDTDGDGYDDLLLGEHGASYDDNDPYDHTGKVTIYKGGDYFNHAPNIVIPKQDPTAVEFFGNSLANAGDINNDGNDDLIVGTNQWGGLTVGRVYVFYGPQRSLDADLTIFAPTEVDQDNKVKWGTHNGMAGLGDINNDGYDDFLVNGDEENSLDGKAYIFLGGENLGDYFTIDGEVGSFGRFGAAAIGLGDITGDGIDDFAISAPAYGTGAAGKIYIYAGSTEITSAGIAPNPNVIESFSLSQNYPNPFNPVTTIQFEISKAQNVTLSIYNSLGQKVKILLDQNMKAGEHQVQWDGNDSSGNKVSTGVYYYRIKTDTHEIAKKMTLLK